MTRTPRERGEVAAPEGPLRTCVVCRRVGPQVGLLRLVRTAEGFVEADPGRRLGGRGVYLCRSRRCLDDVVRRARWSHAFRAPAVLRPDALERLRGLIDPEPREERPRESGDRSSSSVEGGR